MSQMPPPPPGQPAPMGGTPSAAGGNKNLYTILAWALFPPIGSLIFLFVGKDDADVKYNSANATVIHGAALLIYIITIVLSAVTVGLLFFLPLLWYLIWFIVWVIGLILALQAGGRRFAFPGIQGLASKYVPMVEGWAK